MSRLSDRPPDKPFDDEPDLDLYRSMNRWWSVEKDKKPEDPSRARQKQQDLQESLLKWEARRQQLEQRAMLLADRYRPRIQEALDRCLPDPMHRTARRLLADSFSKHPEWGIDEVIEEIYNPVFQQRVIIESTKQ